MLKSNEAVPSISVVVPSYNQGRFLRDNLESIFRQEYPRLEVVVMDGGSTDESVAILQSFAPRLKYWQSCPDGGQAAAINEGMGHCTGEIVGWLNSDDFYWGDCLWTVGRACAASPGYGLYVGNGLRYSQEQDRYKPFNRRHVALNRIALEEGLDYLLQPAVFFSREAWEEAGGLDPSLQYCMDWDVFIRVARARPAVLINEFLAVSREYAETKTSSGQFARTDELLAMIRRHTAQEVTPGGLFYLLEMLLAATSTPALAPARGALYEGMKALQASWRATVGSADGFPEKSDPQDRAYLPFVAGRSPLLARWRERGGLDLPSFSVVVPSFNQARFLPETLDSLVGQNYPRLETVVMDGGSTDGTQEVLRRYEGQLDGWVSEADRGPAHAINKGLARTSGEVVAWLASDDVLTEGAIWEAARLFAEDPDLDLVYGNALYIDENSEPFLADHGAYRTSLYYGEMQPPELIPAYWSYVHAVPQPTVFFRRRLLESCGALDESYKFIFDFELFHRFARKAKVKKIERTQAFYRIHASSKTSSWENFLVELYRFSRPHWPGRFSRDFLRMMREFLAAYVGRRPSPTKWRRRLKKARVALSVWTGWGNPEGFGLRRARRPAPPVGPALPAQPPPQTGACDRPIDRSNLVYRSSFCSFAWPMYPGHSGGEIRDFHLLRHLLSFSRVTYYSLTAVPEDGREDCLARHAEAVHTSATVRAARPHLCGPEAPDFPLRRRVLDRLRQEGWPVLGPRYHRDGTQKVPHLQAALAPALQADLDQEAPDFLFVGPQVNPAAMLLRRLAPRTRLVMASYDVEAVRVARLAAAHRGWLGRLAGRLEASRASCFERDNLARFDGVLAVSDLDKALFVEHYGFPPERVLVVPNGVDLDYFAFAPRPAAAKAVLFTASLCYPPNHQAALRLVDRIMPLVRRRHPDAGAWIVGQYPPADLAAKHDGARVVVTGKVGDVRPYLASAAVTCVPLLAGSGTKYKVLEALSAGTPVVCSPLGVEGLELTDGQHLLVGRTDAELAEAVGRVLSSPALAGGLAARGREEVERLYSWDVCMAGLRPWLGALAAMPRRSEHDRGPALRLAARPEKVYRTAA